LSGTATPGAMGVEYLYCFADGDEVEQPVNIVTAAAKAIAPTKQICFLFFMFVKIFGLFRP
jgi:hypothetical protein